MKNKHSEYLLSSLKEFHYYKSLADNTIDKLDVDQLHWTPNLHTNSVAIIICHVSGNMLSRFTDFLTEDGEKSWRNRDAEFEVIQTSKEALLQTWDRGWACLFNAINLLQEGDLMKIAYIRAEPHTVIQAINRQIAHYSYHVGQIVFIGKMLSDNWPSLSISVGQSNAFNIDKLKQRKK